MEATMGFIFCYVMGAAINAEPLSMGNDPPSLRIPVSHTATIQCCYNCTSIQTITWTQTIVSNNSTSSNSVNMLNTVSFQPKDKFNCSYLTLRNVTVSDTGLYHCILTHGNPSHSFHTPGTFLQVFEPIRKTLNISERAKNSIITAEGVLLLLCLLVPGTMLICKSKGLHELERRKGKEEENIYEGLNLDDCTSTYHQIQRSQVQGPYHDVVNAVEDDIQLEKP